MRTKSRKWQSKYIVLVCMLFLLSGQQLWAGNLTVVNPGFESPALGANGWTYAITGWSLVSGTSNEAGLTDISAAIEFVAGTFTAGDNENILFHNGSRVGRVAPVIGQVLPYDTLQPGLYKLSVDVADRPAIASPNGSYQIQLQANDGTDSILLAEMIDGQNGAPSLPVSPTSGASFMTVTLEFDASSLPAGASYGDSLEIRLLNPAVDAGGTPPQTVFDNVTLEIVSSAENPSPVDGQVDVSENVTLSWEPGEDPNNPGQPLSTIIAYNLYVAVDTNGDSNDPNYPPLTYIDQISADVNTDGIVDASSSYAMSFTKDDLVAWRVDEVLPDANFIAGPVWQFEILKSIPIIIQQPENGGWVADGESVQFEVIASSQSTLTYQWYMSTDAIADASDTLLTGETSSILALTSVTESDEGYYWCKLTNDGGSVDSQAARFGVKQLVAHWKFEDNLLDSTPNGWDGTYSDAVSPVTYDDGIDGRAFSTTSTDFVKITGSGSEFSFQEDGMTVSFWMKTASQGAWAGIVSKDLGAPLSGWGVLQHPANRPTFVIRTDVAAPVPVQEITDSQWHLIVSSYNPQTGVVQMYVDGALTEAAAGSNFVHNTEPLIFGARDLAGTLPFTGLIDDVRLYDYPLSYQEVVDLWVAVNGDICTEYPTYDFTGPTGTGPDCKVDLYDFAVFAAEWMECNLYPSCISSL